MSATDHGRGGMEERVLVLAPTSEDGPLTVAALTAAEIPAEACRGLFDLCHRMEQGCGAVLIAEEAVADTSLEVLVNLLDKQPPWSDLPLVVITGSGNDPASALPVYRAFGPRGNVTLLERPFHKLTLISSVQAALRARRRQYEVRALIERLSTTATSLEKARQELEERAMALTQAQEQLSDYAQQLEKRVEERTGALKATTDQLNAFCYTIAHDLRAPLRSQTGFANILLEDYGEALGKEGRFFVERISDASGKLERLVADLLTYAVLSRQELQVRQVNLVDVIQQVKSDLCGEIEQRKAVIAVDEVGFAVEAHESSLGLIINNLVSNGLKYVREGRAPRIRLWAEERGGFVRLWVEDEGIGIDPQFHDKIFAVFERLHLDKVYPGTGIGLAIVRTGVTRMGGRCGVESVLGQGSRFWIELRKAQQAS